MDSICWWWAHRDDLEKTMETQLPATWLSPFLWCLWLPRSWFSWQHVLATNVPSVSNTAELTSFFKKVRFNQFWTLRFSHSMMQAKWFSNLDILYTYIFKIIYLLTQWKGRWFFSNFRSDHFGRSKVARRSERGGGKKPQVQEKVPCRAIFCLLLSESFFGFGRFVNDRSWLCMLS